MRNGRRVRLQSGDLSVYRSFAGRLLGVCAGSARCSGVGRRSGLGARVRSRGA